MGIEQLSQRSCINPWEVKMEFIDKAGAGSEDQITDGVLSAASICDCEMPLNLL